MTPAYYLPDITVALAALVGLLIVIRRLGNARKADALTHYFRASLSMVAFFLAVRSLYWITQGEFFLHVALFVAPLILVMVLLLAEGLIRRHAPIWIKGFVALGAVMLAFSSLSHAFIYIDFYSYALLTYQLLSFLLVSGMVLLRDRGSLAASENNMIDRISLSLLFILPFLISDFRFAGLEIPVRLSGIAILATCWLSLNLNRPGQSRRSQLAILGLVMAVALVGSGVLAWHFDLGAAQALQIWAVMLALVLLVQIARDDQLLSYEQKRETLQIEQGSKAESSLTDYLKHLESKGALEDVLLVSQEGLDGYELDALRQRFSETPGLTIGDLPGDETDDDLALSQVRALLARNAADHVYLVSHTPLMLAFVKSRSLISTKLDQDLSTGFRLARLIAERDELAAKRKEK